MTIFKAHFRSPEYSTQVFFFRFRPFRGAPPPLLPDLRPLCVLDAVLSFTTLGAERVSGLCKNCYRPSRNSRGTSKPPRVGEMVKKEIKKKKI